MYNFVKSIGLSRSIGSQWKDVDLSDILVYDIYNTYTKVVLELKNNALDKNAYVDMDSLRVAYSGYQGTLEELLVAIGDMTLETVPSLPNTKVIFAKYSDAMRSEYKIKTTIAGMVLPDNYPESEKKDLVVTRPKYGTDMSLIHKYCLVSVNGFYHMTDTDGVVAYVYDGAVTMRKNKNNHMGIFSFYDIGQLQKIKLKPEKIYPTDVNKNLKDKITFEVAEDLDDKSYILVLGGYLVLPEFDVFWRSGEKSFTLDLNKLPYVERIFESHHSIDLSSLGLTTQPINPDAYNVDELYSDAVIKKYMLLQQSFLVLVDTPTLVSNKIFLRHSNLPGMFTCYQDPVYPLIVNYGRAAEYWKVLEDGHWSVTVQDSFLRNYVISQQPVKSKKDITDNMLAGKPFYHSRGFLLEIASYKA